MRTRAWLVVSPIVASGVLVAHSLAYRLTGTPTDAFHAYLGHAPQILLLLLLGGLAFGGLGRRSVAPRPWAFPLAAVATFAVQEHLERLLHAGQLPFLLTTPAFLVGLALQIPVAIAAWLLARWLLAAVGSTLRRRSARGRFFVLQVSPTVASLRSRRVGGFSARAPPQALLST